MIDLEKIKNIFIESSYSNLEKQRLDGSMPSGHNGSYYDEETCIRNTSHWIISFSKAFELTGDNKFFDAVLAATKVLKEEKWRPVSGTFICRNKESKDKCNGLIGQAWAIEGLVKGYEKTNDSRLIDIAQEVFEKHPFCKEKNIWKRVEPNGDIIGFDNTFNHQLWFAMAGFLIIQFVDNRNIKKMCESFFENLSKSLIVSKKGRIRQSLKLGFINDTLKYNIKRVVRKKEVEYMKLKEIGYHAFNTYAFSKIHVLYPNLSFFKSPVFLKIINYLYSEEYRENIYLSTYGFKYNPPSFEVLYTYINTNLNKNEFSKRFVLSLLKKQVSNHYDFAKKSFSKNVHDVETSSSRIYELSECLSK